jgi:hypothetical protein
LGKGSSSSFFATITARSIKEYEEIDRQAFSSATSSQTCLNSEDIYKKLKDHGDSDVVLDIELSVMDSPSSVRNNLAEANAQIFNQPELSDVAFVFQSPGEKAARRFLYSRKRVLCHQSNYFIGMFAFSTSVGHSEPSRVSGTAARTDIVDDCDSDNDSDDDSKSDLESRNDISHVPIRTTAYRTWRALLFYLETGCIFFAPLRSSYPGSSTVESWRSYAHRNRFAYNEINGDYPFECSPKSMYALADMIGLEELKAIAFTRIKASLSRKTILQELSSPFTMKYKEVRSHQLEFLRSRWTSIREETSALKTFLEPLRSGAMSDQWQDLLIDLLQLKGPTGWGGFSWGASRPAPNSEEEELET